MAERSSVEKMPSRREIWDPFSDLDLVRGWPSLRRFAALGDPGLSAPTRWSPSMDVSENDTHYLVSVELAGARKDDVHVEVEDSVLTIRGEKKHEREEKNENRRYTERSYGMFSRSFTLPSNANSEDVKATFADGVLTIEIGKREESKPKSIEVH